MDDNIQERLEQTSQECLKAFAEWKDQIKDKKAQEGLHAAIHELRKVTSRLEIELAISERENITSKPLPIPSHRSTSKSTGSILDDHANSGPVVQTKTKRRRSPGGGQRKNTNNSD